MRRYRINSLNFRFDSRASQLSTNTDNFDEQYKLMHEHNKQKIIESIVHTFGGIDFGNKVARFKEFGDIAFSINCQYIQFIIEIRRSYVMGAYYPALVAACTLGERILNHLFIKLRNDYSAPTNYKNMLNKNSSTDWDKLIYILNEWKVLIKNVPALFDNLKMCRHNAVHYNYFTEVNTKDHTLQAIKLIMEIVSIQYGSNQEYVFMAHDALCIKNSMLINPYVKHIVLENTQLVGFKHQVITTHDGSFAITDEHEYINQEITDAEYTQYRIEYLQSLQTLQTNNVNYKIGLMTTIDAIPKDCNIGLFLNQNKQPEIYYKSPYSIQKLNEVQVQQLVGEQYANTEVDDITDMLNIIQNNLQTQDINSIIPRITNIIISTLPL